MRIIRNLPAYALYPYQKCARKSNAGGLNAAPRPRLMKILNFNGNSIIMDQSP
jgi:hypothetical protein